MLTFKHSGDIIQIETGHKYFEFSMNYFIDRFNCLCNNITNINQEDLTVKKKWLSIMLAGLIALSAPVQASAAWQKTPDQNWQWSENEILAIGWKQIDGVWYHFDAKGNMSTGWMKDGKNWYYLKADGSMKTGWLNDSGQWYYLNGNGVMATGWKTLDGKSYYLNGSGRMTTGWQQVDGKWYHMTSDGVRESGWTEVNGQRYFLDADGVMQTGVVQIDGKTYFLGENGQVLTGRLWVDGERYDFADTGEATGRKKPVPEKAFDTQGNQTQVVEEKPTQPDKEDDDNTHTGSIGGWYPDIDWNPDGGTVNPDPEKPGGGDQGGTEQPDPEEKLRIDVQNGSWKETAEGLEFTVKDGYHLNGDFSVDYITTDTLELDGALIDGFRVTGLDLSESQIRGSLYYYDTNISDNRQTATLNRVSKADNIYILKFSDLKHTFTIRLKVSEDHKTVTWMDVFTSSFCFDKFGYSNVNVSFDVVEDTTDVVYTEEELRSALVNSEIQKVVLGGSVDLENGLVIDRSVEIEFNGYLSASENWKGGVSALISIQNGAQVQLTGFAYRSGAGSSIADTNVIEVLGSSLDIDGIDLYADGDNQTLLYLQNANVRIYGTHFYGNYPVEDSVTCVEMDTVKDSKSSLEILAVEFDPQCVHQIISGSSESVVDLPSGFTKFTNEQSQREWTNDPSKIPS